jgi:hypothetical protein
MFIGFNSSLNKNKGIAMLKLSKDRLLVYFS